MSAGNTALIACVPGLGLMLLAVEASKKKKKIKGPGSDFIRMIESMGITRCGSNCDSSELGCSSTSKQPPLQHSQHMAGMGNTEAVPTQCPRRRGRALCTLSSTALGHHRPQNTASANASSKALTAAARLPCHAMGKPCAISQAAGPGASRVLGACSRSGARRGAGNGTGVMLDPASLARPQGKHAQVHSPECGLISDSTGSLLGTGTAQAGPCVAQPSTTGTATLPPLTL